jgi:hypothetical protein
MIALLAVATAITQNMKELMNWFDRKLESLRSAFGEASGNTGGQQAAGQSRGPMAAFVLQMHRGILSQLPDSFHFPRFTSYDCWTQWNIGNLERSILPLQSLVSKEFQFFDILPKEANKQCGQRGRHRVKWRPASNQYSDLRLHFFWKSSRTTRLGQLQP